MSADLTVRLSETEADMLETLMIENGLNSPAEMLLTLLHDAWWDRAFANSQDVLDKLADEAHAEYMATRRQV